MENRRQRRERERKKLKLAIQSANPSTVESKQRFNDFLALIGVACGFASWGWSVIDPGTSGTFGSVLLFVAIFTIVVAIRRTRSLGKAASVVVAVIALIGFISFDWYIVLRPQRGKPFQDLLIQGYHITSQCGSLPARNQMPDWMRDQSKEWQAQVEQLVSGKLAPKDSQIWNSAIVIGRVSDENTVAYQCMWLADKVAALETIVASDFDHSLKRRAYTGPTYWFEPVNGKVDISEALKAGAGQANIAIEDFGRTSDQPTQVIGSVPLPQSARHGP